MHLRTRKGAAVLLTRPRGSSGGGVGDEGRTRFELFVVERSPQLAFFGGWLAAPGGTLDGGDGDPVDDEPGSRVGLDAAHARCAARELFEESGVLIGALPSCFSGDAARSLRLGLLAGDSAAAQEWRERTAPVPVEELGLRPVVRLTTPPFMPLVHETLFFHAELPVGAEPEIIPGELTGGWFVTPEDLTEEWTRGEVLVVPPVLRMLVQARGRDLEEWLAALRSQQAALEFGTLPEIQSSPGIRIAPLRTPTLPPATSTNTLLVGEELLFVHDPATYDQDQRELLYGCVERQTRRGAEVAGVLVSHHHKDHVGSVWETARRYDVPVLGHPRTLERLPPCEGARPSTRPVLDGDRIELGRAPDGSEGWHLRALHTPGHDQGHLVFLESRYGALLAADLFSTISTIVIDPPEGHLATYLASLTRVRAEPACMGYPAHGPVAREAHAVIDRFLRHRAGREARIMRALAGGAPHSEETLLEQVYDDVAREVLPLAAGSLAAGLEKLSEEGRVERTGRSWRLVDPA